MRRAHWSPLVDLAVRGLHTGTALFGLLVMLLGGASRALVASFWAIGLAAVVLRDRLQARRQEPS